MKVQVKRDVWTGGLWGGVDRDGGDGGVYRVHSGHEEWGHIMMELP